MTMYHYNNIGVSSLAIASVLQNAIELPVSKVFLIMPFVTHRELLSYLGRSTTKIKSIEKLIVDKIGYFSTFNDRFYDTLCLTINVIQFLNDIDVICVSQATIKIKTPIIYDKSMGKRAEKIYASAKNIAAILNNNVENLYLNLRIEI